VLETWSGAETAVARAWRRLLNAFSVADVVEHVEVPPRHVQRVSANSPRPGTFNARRQLPDKRTGTHLLTSKGQETLPSRMGTMSSLVRTSPGETTLVISIRGLSGCSKRLTRLRG
jgi:hypothetical protein